MPLPTPKKWENKEDFKQRFMSSKQAQKDFKSKEQRFAVALQKWRDKNDSKSN